VNSYYGKPGALYKEVKQVIGESEIARNVAVSVKDLANDPWSFFKIGLEASKFIIYYGFKHKRGKDSDEN
jgi:hypothetical protein